MNIAIFRPDINMAAMIQALQANNVLQILAEPNLLTESGKQASFLAGGEFPVPVVQGAVAGGVAPVTIQFKEFGVRLSFTPTLTPDGLIHLNVKPEVSSLDYTNSITISGTTIPALSTRRAESDMELRDGQSFAIAGLIDNQVTEQFDKIPGISAIPVLGKALSEPFAEQVERRIADRGHAPYRATAESGEQTCWTGIPVAVSWAAKAQSRSKRAPNSK